MNEVDHTLLVDLLAWIAARPRTYAETMDAWRTSCPRLPVWEEANDRGFVDRAARMVALTPDGDAFLRAARSNG
ncbi:MAG: hypothetical protein KDA25_09435 [Phycisphaerales bacterium]|nr:hypothetical protein [Phycisphaerales bacterium]